MNHLAENGFSNLDQSLDKFTSFESCAQKKGLKSQGCSCCISTESMVKDHQNPERCNEKFPNGILEVILYIHIPPRFDGIDEDDDECEACIQAAKPSLSFDQVHFCEKSLGNGVNFAEGDVPSFEQIAF